MSNQEFGLCVILTSPVVGYDICAEAAVVCGVRYLQLRMKDTPRTEVIAVARRLKRITAGSPTLLIVNDDSVAALESGADGVHFGQCDLPPDFRRESFAALRLVGISTHNEEQAHAALLLRPDYIGVGPVFATSTKQNHDPALGIDETARIIAAASPLPALAIGGITPERIPALLAAGARNIAVVSAVCDSREPINTIKKLQNILTDKNR